jgi:hypothetical protein
MAKGISANRLSFAKACEYLGLSPDDLVTLREHGLVAYLSPSGKQVYPRAVLDITQRLLKLGQERGWRYETLAWYADLVFAAEIGRAILLPLHTDKTQIAPAPINWLETPYAAPVLADLNEGYEKTDAAIIAPLRSLLVFAFGEGQFWADLEHLRHSTLYPVVEYLEAAGTPITNQGPVVGRDAGAILVGMMFAFTTIAPSISPELLQLVRDSIAKLKGSQTVDEDDPKRISSEGLVAVDKLYASKATEIHSPPDAWDFNMGVLVGRRRTIALEMRELPELAQEIIDNIIDIIRPFVGLFGARVVHLLYEIANDSPYWRNPLVTIDTNEFLDRLGLKRDKHGYHYSENRERLRDALNAAHYLEIVGEYTAWEDGKQVRKAMRRTVLSLIGATFDASENKGLSTADLFRRGLPKTLQIRLNFYDGVRRPDGRLGNQYVLMRPLANPEILPSARHTVTEELLKAYLLQRYRQTRMESRTLTITRGTALEKANISTKNVTWATRILTRALDKLVADGTVESYSSIPIKAHLSFTVVLTTPTSPKQRK